MKIHSVNSRIFGKFGRVLNVNLPELESAAKAVAFPESGCLYRADMEELRSARAVSFSEEKFGGMPVQIGLCWGKNRRMNALEWHKSSEINYAVEGMLLLLGDVRDMEDGKYDSSKLTAFYVAEGECVEIFATTLHFTPFSKDDNVFKSIVILPKGTNTPLEKSFKDAKLAAKNKWLICHPDCKRLVDAGRVVGITGENIEII